MKFCNFTYVSGVLWVCSLCGNQWTNQHGRKAPPKAACGDTHEPEALAERIRYHLQQLSDVTRSPADLDRAITICTTQCKRLGTGRWGEVKYEGCPRFGRPCDGAFEKWMQSLADAKTWCELWGSEQGVFYDVTTTARTIGLDTNRAP